jgi:hypothetical protein
MYGEIQRCCVCSDVICDVCDGEADWVLLVADVMLTGRFRG